MYKKRIKVNKALAMIKNYFPKVTRIVDANKEVVLEVTDTDSTSSDVKTHRSCALAVCAKRTTKADGVIVGLSKAYIIKGKIATRYETGKAIGREITAFDRRAGFATGIYRLTPPCPTQRLDAIKPTGPKESTGKPSRIMQHRTTGVRTVFGHKEEVV